jgi:hypothetical protein
MACTLGFAKRAERIFTQSPAMLASFPFRPAASKRLRAYHEGGDDHALLA